MAFGVFRNWARGSLVALIVFAGSAHAQLSAFIAWSNTSCYGSNDGFIAVTAVGTSPYTYSWTPPVGTSNFATGLSAGTYTVHVTDNAGLTADRTVTIAQPPELKALIAQTNPIGGNDGSATVSASGGTPPYSYLWGPSGGTGATANNLGPGTYTVTVSDANACQKVQSVTLTGPPQAPNSIPTLSEWGVIGLSSLMAMFGLSRMRRRNT